MHPRQRELYMRELVHSLNQSLLMIKQKKGIGPEFMAAGGRFTQEIQAALLQLGARPDTIVSFTPNWKSY